MRTLPPNTASQHFDLLHSELLNSHLNNICPQSVSHEPALSFKLSSPHLDVRQLASLPLALGGHGFLPFSHNNPPHHSNPPINQSDFALTYHHAPFMHLGHAHGAVSELGFPLSETKPSLPSLSPLLTRRLYPHSKLRLSTHRWPSTLHLLVRNPTPTEHAYPLTTPSPPSSIHSWMVRTCLSLLDGENMPFPDATIPPQSTANNSLSSKHPSRLIPPSSIPPQLPISTSKVQAAVSSLVSSLAFLDEYLSRTD